MAPVSSSVHLLQRVPSSQFTSSGGKSGESGRSSHPKDLCWNPSFSIVQNSGAKHHRLQKLGHLDPLHIFLVKDPPGSLRSGGFCEPSSQMPIAKQPPTCTPPRFCTMRWKWASTSVWKSDLETCSGFACFPCQGFSLPPDSKFRYRKLKKQRHGTPSKLQCHGFLQMEMSPLSHFRTPLSYPEWQRTSAVSGSKKSRDTGLSSSFPKARQSTWAPVLSQVSLFASHFGIEQFHKIIPKTQSMDDGPFRNPTQHPCAMGLSPRLWNPSWNKRSGTGSDWWSLSRWGSKLTAKHGGSCHRNLHSKSEHWQPGVEQLHMNVYDMYVPVPKGEIASSNMGLSPANLTLSCC